MNLLVIFKNDFTKNRRASGRGRRWTEGVVLVVVGLIKNKKKKKNKTKKKKQ
jgi:hypothetical protein